MSDAAHASAPVAELPAGLHRIPLGGGFVSAYLLDCDGELALVDTGLGGGAATALRAALA